jgi:23S rRNA pseudouridine2605 synthase
LTSPNEKLQKVLARRGLGSRRQIEKLIAEGRVRVNGLVAQLGDRVVDSDRFQIDGRKVDFRSDLKCRVLIYNKPDGEISTRHDPEGRPTVFDNLPKIGGGRWISVGRLDVNTSGLLLFTNSGELAHKLSHPSSELEREYRVRLFGEVDTKMIDRLKAGVELEDGPAKFLDVQLDGAFSGSNRWATVTLAEGRNREVRRLWESENIQVSRLKRTRFGPITLSDRLRRGQLVDATAEQVKALWGCVDVETLESETD